MGRVFGIPLIQPRAISWLAKDGKNVDPLMPMEHVVECGLAVSFRVRRGVRMEERV